VLHFAAETATAELFLLRFETVGYEAAEGDGKPKEKLLRSLEVVTQPGSVFFAKADLGLESLLISGKLLPENDGYFELHLHYAYSRFKRDDTEPDGRAKNPASTSSRTQLAIELGKRVVVSQLKTTQEDLDGSNRKRTLIRNTVILKKFDLPQVLPKAK
jgi:hypothetical protein